MSRIYLYYVWEMLASEIDRAHSISEREEWKFLKDKLEELVVKICNRHKELEGKRK